ncbi:MAG TPA: sugar ABC transporter ATP-binding protein [Solirubrobacteraceae bacterium]|jgi:ribose transport system ATP-binding protein|nr:sugar ABC transporter ATP-binding protein [Solirubrobacteraceae bacterium]
MLTVESVSKRFGTTHAVKGVSLTVAKGAMVGIAGHNGAGKSTLLRIVSGVIAPDEGQIVVAGEALAVGSQKQARLRGVRMVHQELSLCPQLTVEESGAIADRRATGLRWRGKSWQRLQQVLDEMFPGHGIGRRQRVAELPVARQQMLECAIAILAGGDGLRLLVLDEPTSALDGDASQSLYEFLHRRAETGLSVIVTTHRLNEMVTHLEHVFVMRDGAVVGDTPCGGGSGARILRLMGGVEAEVEQSAAGAAADHGGSHNQIRIRIAQSYEPTDLTVTAGEVVGLAGLEGHGQREVLAAVFDSAPSGSAKTQYQDIAASGTVAYVSGDRSQRGIFRYWSVRDNASIASLKKLTLRGLLSGRLESDLIDDFRRSLSIVGAPDSPIVSLSGGNQQKVLMARALAADAEILLLDDPTRGVDQMTKADIYRVLKDQASKGVSVVWFSTEIEELQQCDRSFVLREGRIVDVITSERASEAGLIAASFEEIVRSEE